MTEAREWAPRRERLRVRLTAEEANYIAELAAARGLTVSDLVRAALLRGRGPHRVGRRSTLVDSAEAIRELGAIGMELRRLVSIAQATGTIADVQLGACLARVRAAVAGLSP